MSVRISGNPLPTRMVITSSVAAPGFVPITNALYNTSVDSVCAFVAAAAALGTPAPIFPAACLTKNPIVGILGNATNPATVTPPASFTETIDTGYATPTAGFEAIFSSSGITVSTLTWGSTSASVFGALALELDISDLTAADTVRPESGWVG